MDKNIILNWARRIIGKDPIDDMPKWIVFHGKPSGLAGDVLFPSASKTYGKIDKERAYGLNKYGFEYTFVTLEGRHIPFWREKTYEHEWSPLTKAAFNTSAEYEMFLMLNPQINKEDLEKFE